MDDYERRLLLFYGIEGHVTDYSLIDDIIVDGDSIGFSWGS